jgi:hypothetical protein
VLVVKVLGFCIHMGHAALCPLRRWLVSARCSSFAARTHMQPFAVPENELRPILASSDAVHGCCQPVRCTRRTHPEVKSASDLKSPHHTTPFLFRSPDLVHRCNFDGKVSLQSLVQFE